MEIHSSFGRARSCLTPHIAHLRAIVEALSVVARIPKNGQDFGADPPSRTTPAGWEGGMRFPCMPSPARRRITVTTELGHTRGGTRDGAGIMMSAGRLRNKPRRSEPRSPLILPSKLASGPCPRRDFLPLNTPAVPRQEP